MFIGHYGVALAAKRVASRTSLGTLFMAAQFADLLWPLFLLLRIEHVRIEPGNTMVTPLNFSDYPVSHSLAAVLLWSAAFGVVYFLLRRYVIGSIVVGVSVLSHWVLDAIVHRPDLPVIPGVNLYAGFGLWNSLTWTVVVEALLFLAGAGMYLRSTVAGDARGTYGVWLLLAVLVVIWIANIFGPTPPGVKAIAIAGNASWLFVFWAYWIDRHRAMKAPN